MSERKSDIIVNPRDLTEDEVRALEKFLNEKRESIFNRWPERKLNDIEEFIKDYRDNRDRFEEEFLREHPEMTPEDWKNHPFKPRPPQDHELEEPQISEQNTNNKSKDGQSNDDPRMTSMVEMAASPITNPGKAALLKPVEKLTQSEMTDMINSAQGDYRGYRSGDPLKAHTYEKVQDWHINIYGDGPQANDGGKPVDPTPIRAIPDQPSPHVTPQGEDLWQATGRLGSKVAEAAATDGADNAVKSLQRGLNMLGDANPLPARSAAYAPYTKLAPVDEDGAYGPQTDFALKHATARLGPGKVEEAFALGRFNTFAREAQRSGNAEGLEAKTHTVFAPLFRDPADTKAPKLEGGALQETLNTLGPRGQDDWTPLKVDNWIGPKTTEAFGKVLKAEDADGITAAFGRGLGFL